MGARSLAVDVLRYVAAHDYRTITEDDVAVWEQAILRHPENAPGDYRAAVEAHYDGPGVSRAKVGDIVHEATRIRRARLGLDALPRSSGRGVPMPEHLRAQFGLDRGARETA